MNTASIRSRLREIERTHDVRVLYAGESGSRAWGLASPDNDYDILFLYRKRHETYLSPRKYSDTLQFRLDADLHDIAGWDVL